MADEDHEDPSWGMGSGKDTSEMDALASTIFNGQFLNIFYVFLVRDVDTIEVESRVKMHCVFDGTFNLS
jgi:hypothetical protein